jgi:hypothetical protein
MIETLLFLVVLFLALPYVLMVLMGIAAALNKPREPDPAEDEKRRRAEEWARIADGEKP